MKFFFLPHQIKWPFIGFNVYIRLKDFVVSFSEIRSTEYKKNKQSKRASMTRSEENDLALNVSVTHTQKTNN